MRTIDFVEALGHALDDRAEAAEGGLEMALSPVERTILTVWSAYGLALNHTVGEVLGWVDVPELLIALGEIGATQAQTEVREQLTASEPESTSASTYSGLFAEPQETGWHYQDNALCRRENAVLELLERFIRTKPIRARSLSFQSLSCLPIASLPSSLRRLAR
jgi:hypothetical protein